MGKESGSYTSKKIKKKMTNQHMKTQMACVVSHQVSTKDNHDETPLRSHWNDLSSQRQDSKCG